MTAWFRYSTAIALAVAVLLSAWAVTDLPQEGRVLAFSILSGAAFGFVLQRSRFCFYCIARDYFEFRDANGLLGLLLALGVGLVGYYVLFSVFSPTPVAGRLPAGAHIGPVSWVLAVGAATFGFGMALAGSCISAHLYRLGEGSLASIVALLGAIIGFGLGFASWNPLYLATIHDAPIVWLPHRLGYGWSLLIQLVVLFALAAVLLRGHRAPNNSNKPSPLMSAEPNFRRLGHVLFAQRWPTYVGGLLVAVIGVMAFLRSGALGVTAELGSIARTTAANFDLLPARLFGLDGFAGCATVVKQTLLSRNGLFVVFLIAGSWCSALLANEFRLQWPSGTALLRNFAGGVLMGWGGMLALGCTVGTLLSGIMAGALSGWLFAVFCFLGAWLGWKLRKTGLNKFVN
ncbi:MAG TPA: YeeE/YedE family protein [Burkholderiaceae bacterium]|nr:YeeE/YedE family protein [Burkholderiaceae bacterium]